MFLVSISLSTSTSPIFWPAPPWLIPSLFIPLWLLVLFYPSMMGLFLKMAVQKKCSWSSSVLHINKPQHNKVCQFMHSPSDVHWQAIKHILRYLQGTSHHDLSIQVTLDYNLTCFTNLNYTSILHDRQSINNYCVFMGSNLISWSLTKQKNCISFHCWVWIQDCCKWYCWTELDWLFFLRTQHCLYDCQSSLSWSKKACRDWLSFCLRKDGSKNSTLSPALFISVNYTPSIHQLAVYLTKAVPIQRFLHFWNKLTVLTRPLSLQEEGGGVWINRVIHINKVLILAIFRFWSLYSIRPCVQIVSLIHSLYIAHFYGKHNTITNLLQLFPLFSSPFFFLFISLKALFLYELFWIRVLKGWSRGFPFFILI